MNLWDTHCHIYKDYYPSISDEILNANQVGVTNCIVSGCDSKSNEEVLSIISNYSSCFGVIGIHPEEVDHYSNQDVQYILNNIHNDRILGIGEIGLDYHYTEDNKEEQKKLFELQLSLAEQSNLPVVIHSREATQDTIDILKKYKVKGVIHSFSGSLEVAQIYIKMGFKLGINGVVTFKNSRLKEILPFIKDHIVLETDSPFLTPHPYRGTKNSPKYIRNIAEFIASELKISIHELEVITNKNIRLIFDKIK